MLKRNVFILKFTVFCAFGTFLLKSPVKASNISSYELISDQCCSDPIPQSNATGGTQQDGNYTSLEKPELLGEIGTNTSFKTNRASGSTAGDIPISIPYNNIIVNPGLALDLSFKTNNISEPEDANQRANVTDKNHFHFTVSGSNSNGPDSKKSSDNSPVNNSSPLPYIQTLIVENPGTTVKNEDLHREAITNSEVSTQTSKLCESPKEGIPNEHSSLQFQIIKTNTNPTSTISSHSDSSNYIFEIVLLNSSEQAEGSHIYEEQTNGLKNYYLLETNDKTNSSIEIRDNVYKSTKEPEVNQSSDFNINSHKFNSVILNASITPAVQNSFKNFSVDYTSKNGTFVNIETSRTELLNNKSEILTEVSDTSSENLSTSSDPQEISLSTSLDHLKNHDSSLNITGTNNPVEKFDNSSLDLYNPEDETVLFTTSQENITNTISAYGSNQNFNNDTRNRTCSTCNRIHATNSSEKIVISENSEAYIGNMSSSSFEILITSSESPPLKGINESTVENSLANNFKLKVSNQTNNATPPSEPHNTNTSYQELISSETNSESTTPLVDRIPSVLLAKDNNHPASNNFAISEKQLSAFKTSSNHSYLDKSQFQDSSSHSLGNKTLLSTNDFRFIPKESSTSGDSLILTTNDALKESSRNDKKLSQNFSDLWNNSILDSHRIESNSKLSKDFMYNWRNKSSESGSNETNVLSAATLPPTDNKEVGKIFWKPLTNLLSSTVTPPFEEPTTEGKIFWNLCFTRKPGLFKNPKEIMMTSGPANTKVFWNLCPTKKPYPATTSTRPTETAVHSSTSTTSSPLNSIDVPSNPGWSGTSTDEVLPQTTPLAEDATTTQITEATDVTEAATEETTQSLEEQKEYLFPVYWNVPTFQCHKYGLNFSRVKDWGLRQNYQDEFRGEEIAILYDPGEFPALLPASAGRRVQRNGGVPQEGSLTRHLSLFEGHLEKLIPDANFSGLAIIDFEHWRPVWRQNWGSLSPYRDFSRLIERRRHPFWFSTMVEVEATYRYELGARVFLLDTLRLGKKLRPRAKWGYYGFPFCFNYTPYNNRAACSYEVQLDNDNMYWLFSETTAHYPSLYLKYNDMYSTKRKSFIKGRLDEALRVAQGVPVYPYVWYKYHDNHQFLTKGDMVNLLKIPKDYGCKGAVIWGASRDVNSRQKCIALQSYLDEVIGPAVRDLQEDTFRGGDVYQEEEEDYEEDFDEDGMDFNEKKTSYDIRDFEV